MKADHSPCSQTDPLGLARFLNQKSSKTKTAINEAMIKESKDATGSTTSESEDATATKEYVTINGQRYMTAVLLRLGGASPPSEEEADSDSPNADVLREIAAAVKRTPQGIERDMQHSEGAALHAGILAGKEALAKGIPKHEVAAVIESAGANVCGLETWRRSDSILIAEADLIGTRAQRFGTPQEQADLEYMATGH